MNTQLPTTQPASTPVQDDEIDLLELAKKIWNGRYTILKVMLLTGVLGIVIALLSPEEYTSTTTMVPQTAQSGSKLGGLSSLAAMAGFNLDMASGSEALSPMVYPQILQSGPFLLELMNTPFTFSDVNHPVSLYQYYTEIQKPGVLSLISKYTIGLPSVVISAIKGKRDKKMVSEGTTGLIEFTEKQEKVAKLLKENVTLTIDSKNGYLTLQASFHEAMLSAQVADQSRELLQKYITRFKTEKAASKLAFIEDRYQEKKKDFEKAQERLAWYRDQNRNMSSAVARTEEERLQSEFSIAMNVYNELAKQLEQAKIQVKEETPVFSVLEPALVPYEKTKPKKTMIVLIWLFLGAIAGAGIVFGKDFLSDIKQKWNENSLAVSKS